MKNFNAVRIKHIEVTYISIAEAVLVLWKLR